MVFQAGSRDPCTWDVAPLSESVRSPVAKPARQFGHAMQIINHYHYSFL